MELAGLTTTARLVRTARRSLFRITEQINLLLIDVEGAESHVLQGIGFATTRPRYVLVENVSVIGGSEHIRSLLKILGYRLVARIGMSDDLSVRAWQR